MFALWARRLGVRTLLARFAPVSSALGTTSVLGTKLTSASAARSLMTVAPTLSARHLLAQTLRDGAVTLRKACWSTLKRRRAKISKHKHKKRRRKDRMKSYET
ncbi:hypothetical protein M885DRAFT_552605 [Pelagophyceae sp. CCMP2097]|nr:hypothetical protein M885DRAFT_552605 [Pelagophyceae sp. CCMP2097]|mmetsp:Transcript_31281/g.105268  ORF Transcript_31281/g.105268 Transcript_31281/m.105268 type:complete len:103 (+) Transcript_31281:51-359(+)